MTAEKPDKAKRGRVEEGIGETTPGETERA
jgi:hypothetical protein